MFRAIYYMHQRLSVFGAVFFFFCVFGAVERWRMSLAMKFSGVTTLTEI